MKRQFRTYLFFFCCGCFQNLESATLQVTNTLTTGAGSFRNQAAAAQDGDIVQFNIPTPPYNITLATLTPVDISKSIILSSIVNGNLNIFGTGFNQFNVNLSTSTLATPYFTLGDPTMTSANVINQVAAISFINATRASNFNMNSSFVNEQGLMQMGTNWNINFNQSNTLNCGIILAGNNTFNVASGRTVTNPGTISGLDLTKSGPGTLMFTGSLNYTGATTVFDGTLSLSSPASYTGATLVTNSGILVLAGSGGIQNSVAVTLIGSGIINTSGLSGQATLQNLNGGSSNALLNLGAQPLNLSISSPSSYYGTFSGTGSITKTGVEKLALWNDSPLFSGSFILESGTLEFNRFGGLSQMSRMVMDANVTLDISGVIDTIIINNLSDTDTTSVIQLGSKTLQFNQTIDTAIFSTINENSPGGSIIKSGDGTLILRGTINYTGDTTVNGNGVLSFQDTAVIPIGRRVSVNSGTLDMAQMNPGFPFPDIFLGTLVGTGDSALVTYGSNTLFISYNTTDEEYYGNIDGNEDFYKLGDKALTVYGLRGIFGRIFIDGSLVVMGTTDLSSPKETYIQTASGILDYSGYPTDASIKNLGSVVGGQFLISTLSTTLNYSTGAFFLGVMSGAGNIIKNGGATLTLTGVQNIGGVFTIDEGAVSLESNGSIESCSEVIINGQFDLGNLGGTATISNLSGPSSGVINLGGNGLDVNSTQPLSTYYGLILGDVSADFTKKGAGTLQIGGDTSNFLGSISITEGTLAVIPGGTFANSAALSIQSGAVFDISTADTNIFANDLSGGGNILLGSNTLYFTTTQPMTFNGVISGQGGINLNTVDLLTLTAPQTYTGGTAIATGILQLTGDGDIGFSSVLSLGTVLDISGVTNSTRIQKIDENSAGSILLGSKKLIISSTDNFSYFGTFSGSGTIEKSNTNNLNLVTASPNFTGAIVVEGGQLGLNADFSAASVTVRSGQRLYGSGIAGAFTNQGTVVPGNSIGIITLASYTQSSTGVLEMEIAADGTSDLLDVLGPVNLQNGSTLDIVLIPGFYGRGLSYTIINGNNVSGTFSNVNIPSQAFLTLDYDDPTKVRLILERNTFILPDTALSVYGEYMKNLLFCNRVRARGDMLNIKIALTNLTGPELARALNNLMPAQITGIPLVELENTNRMISLIQNRIYRFKDDFCSTSKDFPRATVWITPTTFWGRQKSNGDTFAFKYNTTGFNLGVEGAVNSNFVCGLAGGYTYSLVEWNDSIGRAYADDLYLAPYIAGRFKRFTYSASIMGSNDRTKLNRYIQFGNIDLTATSKLNGWNLVTMADVKGEFDCGRNFYFLPEASVTLAQLFRQKANERGAGSLNVHYPYEFNSTMRTYLNLWSGVRICSTEQIALDYKMNVGYLNTQMFTNNLVKTQFYAPNQVCSPFIDAKGNLPSINQGVVGFALSANRFDLVKFQFDGSYTFGGPTAVAELNFSLEKIF
ncbi:MAG: autotransporter domain-containing protein [Chlamydiia bacterium]